MEPNGSNDFDAVLIAQSSRIDRIERGIFDIRSQLAGLAALVRNSEAARASNARAVNSELAELRRASAEQAELLGRVLAELAHRARVDAAHTEAITGAQEEISSTRTELAIARARWVGWRGLAVAIGWGILEAIKHILSGSTP